MALPIQRVKVSASQQVEESDGNAFGALGLDALYQTLKAMLGIGWVRLGTLEVVSGMQIILRAPTAAITAHGLAVTPEDEAVTPNVGHLTEPRIDLLSIGWQEVERELDLALRTFIDSNDEEGTQETQTRKTWEHVLTYTEGENDPDPVPPETPANHIPLYHVAVGAGVTALTANDITPVVSGAAGIRSVGLAASTWAGVGATPQALPYTTPTLLSFQAKGAFTVIAATLTIVTLGSYDPALTMRPLLISIEDAASGAIVGRAEHQMFRGEYRTVTVVGVLTGPTSGSRNYRLKVTPGLGNGNVHSGLVVPALHDDQASAVINAIAAVSF